MRERVYINPDTYQTTFEHVMALQDELEAQANGAAPSPVMAAAAQRSLSEFTTNPEFFDVLVEYAQHNPEASPSQSARQLYQSQQYLTIPLPEAPFGVADFPHGFDAPDRWDHFFKVIKDPIGMYLFRQHMIWEPIQANDAQRGLPLKATIQAFGIEDLHLYSGGGSMGLPVKQLHLSPKKDFHFLPVGVGNRQRGGEFVPSESLTHQLGALACAPNVKLAESLVVDRTTPRFREMLNWALSNTYRPESWADPDVRSRTDRLYTTTLRQLKYMRDDYTLLDHPARLREEYPYWKTNSFNVLEYSTSLYQNNRLSVAQAYRNAQQLAGPDAIIVVQDFVRQGPGGKLYFVKHWRPWDYNQYVLDVTKPDAGWQHMWSMRDPRVTTDIEPGKNLKRKIAQNGGKLAIGMMRGDAA